MTKQEGQHPLMSSGLPGWLHSVPMDVEKPYLMPLGGEGGKSISLQLLIDAKVAKVGSEIGLMAIASPELREFFAEQTGNHTWRHMPTERTSIRRDAEDVWTITVGDFTKTVHGAELDQYIDGTHPSYADER
jgi:hypothetical protein